MESKSYNKEDFILYSYIAHFFSRVTLRLLEKFIKEMLTTFYVENHKKIRLLEETLLLC